MNTKIIIHTCPKFWNDCLVLRKSLKRKEFKSYYGNGDLRSDAISTDEKIESIPIIKLIATTIINALQYEDKSLFNQITDPCDRQPFLANGWEIRKMRYAINSTGKSDGLRIIFCINNEHVLLTYVATKNLCSREEKLESEYTERIKAYISI